jgi:hypothetical protein
MSSERFAIFSAFMINFDSEGISGLAKQSSSMTMTTTKAKRKQARASVDVKSYERIERIAERDGLRPSEVVRLAIAHYLREVEPDCDQDNGGQPGLEKLNGHHP